jgi:hypothetical protein
LGILDKYYQDAIAAASQPVPVPTSVLEKVASAIESACDIALSGIGNTLLLVPITDIAARLRLYAKDLSTT